jgi:hypothetical protein
MQVRCGRWRPGTFSQKTLDFIAPALALDDGPKPLICPSCQSAAIGGIDLDPKSAAHLECPVPHKRGVARSSRRWVRDAVDAGSVSDD